MQDTTWVQCQDCGKIYEVPYAVSVDELYIVAYCTRCEGRIALNLGSKDDVYLYYDHTLDERFYEYNTK